MKKIATAVMVLFVGMTFAQEPGKTKERKTPEERAQHKTDKMEEHLGLTADQKEMIYDINLEAAKKHVAKREMAKEERKAKHEEMKAEREKIEAAILDVLDDDQDAKFLQMKEERKAKHEERKAKKKACRKECSKNKTEE